MLFALVGFYRKGVEDDLLEIAPDVNEYLGQPIIQAPRLAAVFSDENGNRLGNLVIVEAPDFDAARTRLQDSPAQRTGLYERCEIAKLHVEIGGIPPP